MNSSQSSEVGGRNSPSSDTSGITLGSQDTWSTTSSIGSGVSGGGNGGASRGGNTGGGIMIRAPRVFVFGDPGEYSINYQEGQGSVAMDVRYQFSATNSVANEFPALVAPPQTGTTAAAVTTAMDTGDGRPNVKIENVNEGDGGAVGGGPAGDASN